MSVCGDVFNDRLNRLLGIAEFAEREWNGLINDLEGSAANKFLELDEGEVRLDTGGIAIHHQADRSSWCEN